MAACHCLQQKDRNALVVSLNMTTEGKHNTRESNCSKTIDKTLLKIIVAGWSHGLTDWHLR